MDYMNVTVVIKSPADAPAYAAELMANGVRFEFQKLDEFECEFTLNATNPLFDNVRR